MFYCVYCEGFEADDRESAFLTCDIRSQTITKISGLSAIKVVHLHQSMVVSKIKSSSEIMSVVVTLKTIEVGPYSMVPIKGACNQDQMRFELFS